MLPAKLNQWLSTNGLKVEIPLIVLILISVVLKNAGYQDIVSPLMMLMFTLAAYYFFCTYMPADVKGRAGLASIKICCISSSLCVIYLLFAIMHWHVSLNILFMASVSLGIAGLILFASWLKTRNNKLVPFLIRSIVVGSIGMSAFITLQSTQVRWSIQTKPNKRLFICVHFAPPHVSEI